MPQLQVGNTIFQYPDVGSEAGWGEDATGWAEAVTNTLAALIGPGDILPTTLSISNNVASPTALVGFAFNKSIVRAANVIYHITRKSNTTLEMVESGMLIITAQLTSATTPIWTMTQTEDRTAGVSFSIDDTGQIYYLSTDIGSAGYTGFIKFSAKTLST